MKYKEIIKIKNLLYFNNSILTTLFPKENITEINKSLSLLENAGKIIRLKRSMYITLDQFNDAKTNFEFLATIATAIRKPSYLSTEYVLRKYNVLTEATYGYTLITTKSRSSVKNRLGEFKYNQITPKLFTGYNAFTYLNYEYYESTKAKALFDWIYFKRSIIPYTKNINLVEELRLNLEEYTDNDFSELIGYTFLIKNIRINKIINNIIKYAHLN